MLREALPFRFGQSNARRRSATLGARRFGRRAGAGFTVIELIATLIIIGILAVFAMPRLSLFAGIDEIGYRDQVVAALQFARKAAVAGRRYVEVSRSGNRLTFRIAGAPDNADFSSNNPRQLSLPGVGKNYLDPPGSVSLSGAGTLIFHPDGSITGAESVLTDNASGNRTIIFNINTSSGLQRIRHNSLTGYISHD